jgi:hypothetical protein
MPLGVRCIGVVCADVARRVRRQRVDARSVPEVELDRSSPDDEVVEGVGRRPSRLGSEPGVELEGLLEIAAGQDIGTAYSCTS